MGCVGCVRSCFDITFNSIGCSRPVRVRHCWACTNCLLCKWSIERFSISYYSFVFIQHTIIIINPLSGLPAYSPTPNTQHSHYFSSSYLNNHFAHILYGIYFVYYYFYILRWNIKVHFLWFCIWHRFLLPFFYTNKFYCRQMKEVCSWNGNTTKRKLYEIVKKKTETE